MRGLVLSTLLIGLICVSQCEEPETVNVASETPESEKQDAEPATEDGSSGIQHGILLLDKPCLRIEDKVQLFLAKKSKLTYLVYP